MAKPVKIGIIGLGWPGREHLKGYKTFPEAQVVALCDMNQELLAQQAKEHGVAQTFTSHVEMLKKAELDAVSVCLPNFLHAPIALDALKAGKHVICEKPPAMNAKEAEAMAAAAKKGGKVLMYALCMRFMGVSKTVRAYVDAGEFGDVYFGRAVYHRRRGIPIGAKGWFVDKSRAGGGSLIDIGVHALDCVWWLMGSPKPVSVSGSAYSKFAHTVPKGIKYDVDDSAFALIKFDNDATLILEASWALNQRGGGIKQIAGTKGGAEFDPLVIFTERNGMQVDITPKPPQNNPFADQVRHFVDCVQNNKEPIASARQGILLMKMLDAVYESSRTGKEVRIR